MEKSVSSSVSLSTSTPICDRGFCVELDETGLDCCASEIELAAKLMGAGGSKADIGPGDGDLLCCAGT